VGKTAIVDVRTNQQHPLSLKFLQMEAQHIIEAWRIDYNKRSPHKFLGYLTRCRLISGEIDQID
jgi:hypothetical protein